MHISIAAYESWSVVLVMDLPGYYGPQDVAKYFWVVSLREAEQRDTWLCGIT